MSYTHLNKKNEIGLSIPQIAEQLCSLNYGCARMLEAILEARKKSDYNVHSSYRQNTQDLEKLLKTGWH